MKSESNPRPKARYACFETSIRLYRMFGVFTEKTPTGWLDHIAYLIPWGSWSFFSISLGLNLIILINKYLQDPGFALKGTEIFQRSFEAFLAPLFLLEMAYFVTSHHQLVLEMRQKFDTEPAILEQVAKQEKNIVIFSSILMWSNMVVAYYRKLFFGLPPSEVELVTYYYRKARPERQLPFIMWLPFDDTEDPMYYFAALLNVYLMVITAVLAIHVNSCNLIFAIHVRGQFQILAKYLRNIGNPRLFAYREASGCNETDDAQLEGSGFETVENLESNRTDETRRNSGTRERSTRKSTTITASGRTDPNTNNNPLSTATKTKTSNVDDLSLNADAPPFFSWTFFGKTVTSIPEPAETNKSTFRSSHNVRATSTCEDIEVANASSGPNLQTAAVRGRNLELDSLVYIVRRHQYLIDFRNRLESRLKVMVLIKMLTFDIVVTVSLYQLSFVSNLDVAAMQLIIQFLASLSLSFVVTHASELLEQGNVLLRRAAFDNPWPRALRLSHARDRTPARNAHVRLLLIVMRMCDQPTRLMYFGGTIDVCYRTFVSVLRFCYSVFALLKHSIRVK